jgi:hypothetical protein
MRHLLGGQDLMGKLVNFRTARKQRDRAAARQRSAEAAARTSEGEAEAARREAEAELARRRLDGHRRGPEEP